MTTQFPHLFTPFKFRTFEIRNRIVMPPMAVYLLGSGGFVQQKMIHYYEARAAGGVGYIIVNATYVHPNGSSHPNQTVITDDKFIPGFARLVEAIHRHGVKTSLQLYHSGRQRYGMETVLTGFDTVVIAAGVVPDNGLGLELKARFDHVYLVGDCEKAGDFRKAVHDGANVGIQI